jgi:hypothetical protein
MNRQQAINILALYRPGTADADDAAFAEALRLCERDPELRRWFDGHCELYLALRAKFRQVPVPEGLKEQIIAERKVHTTPFWRRPTVVLAAVAALAVLMGLVSLWRPSREDTGFNVYAERMTRNALRGYAMDLATNDPVQVRDYLARYGAPSDYTVPAPLARATLTGCAIMSWQGASVSMICFRSGKPLPPGQSTDLWLFVIHHASIAGAPTSATPSVASVNRAATARWTQGDETYLLVTDGDETFLRRYL